MTRMFAMKQFQTGRRALDVMSSLAFGRNLSPFSPVRATGLDHREVDRLARRQACVERHPEDELIILVVRQASSAPGQFGDAFDDLRAMKFVF
jgi:vacuolar-type H+-ATPase subunit B/Vma2